MAKIVCGVGECSHNKLGECYANFVSIVGVSAKEDCDTCCSSFLDKITYADLTSNHITGDACTCLDCKVETCAHNENSLCNLDHIKVDGDNVNAYSETNCLSFQPQN